MPPRLGRSSNYVRLWPFWSPFKIPCCSLLHGRDGNRGGISLMLLPLFWGHMWAPGICHTPVSQLVCLTVGQTFTPSRLRQRFPIGQGDGCNHTRGLYYTLHKTYVWKYPLYSREICLSTFWVDRVINIHRLFFIARQSFRERAVYCDTSSIVLKWNCSFEVF